MGSRDSERRRKRARKPDDVVPKAPKQRKIEDCCEESRRGAECQQDGCIGFHQELKDDSARNGVSSTRVSTTALGGNKSAPHRKGHRETHTHVQLDVFGNSHPPVASDLIECHNCGRTVAAGRFAPHLHKCIGKGRQASRQASKAWAGMLQTAVRGAQSGYRNQQSRNRPSSKDVSQQSVVTKEHRSAGGLQQNLSQQVWTISDVSVSEQNALQRQSMQPAMPKSFGCEPIGPPPVPPVLTVASGSQSDVMACQTHLHSTNDPTVIPSLLDSKVEKGDDVILEPLKSCHEPRPVSSLSLPANFGAEPLSPSSSGYTSSTTAEICNESLSPCSNGDDVDVATDGSALQKQPALLLRSITMSAFRLAWAVPTRKRCGRLISCDENSLRRVRAKI